MDRYIVIVLPIAWAIISTVIALLLYRTSDAFFEQQVPDEKGRRRIKLVGSIVIAGVVFLGLAKFTDMSQFSEIAANQQRVSRAALIEHRQAMTSLRNTYEELRGCIAIARKDQCDNEMEKLAARIESAEAGLNEIEHIQK
jgi:hypothetical protein